MKNKFFTVMLLIFSFFITSGIVEAAANPLLSVENVTYNIGEEIIVPIKVSNNSGICGATLSVKYSAGLSLKDIKKGDGLLSLTMTKPGDLKANPFTLPFDGIEEDKTNGVIAYLYFDALSKVGEYNISVTYSDGDIVNGNLTPINVDISNGKVSVVNKTNQDGSEENKEPINKIPTIKIGDIAASANATIDVPVYISGNTGICGATLKFAYNDELTLTKITQGTALSSLTMTKPGNFNANPFVLPFDGMEADISNGIFVTLTFLTPQNDGVYEISASYENGDIVDGNLQNVEVLIEKGMVVVGENTFNVSIGNGNVIVSPSESQGNIYVAFLDKNQRLISVQIFNLTQKNIEVKKETSAKTAKIFCWNSNLKPLCTEQTITIN